MSLNPQAILHWLYEDKVFLFFVFFEDNKVLILDFFPLILSFSQPREECACGMC